MNLFDVQFDGAGNVHYSPNSTTIPDSDPPCDAIDPNDLIDDEWSEPAQEGFSLRPYQHEAVKRIEAELYGATGKGDALSTDPHNSSLLVMATGLGKTVIVSEVVKRRKPGKALMIAHRGELIYQAKTTLESLCGEPVTVEMADRYARMDQNIVVATVQTLIAGMGGDGRMVAFDPNDFSLLVTDECATGDTLITLADGETRSIREIYDANRQVQVMSVNQVGDVVPATVVGRKRSVSHRIVSVVLSDGTTIRCTRDHLFFTNNGFLPASLLTQEHIVLKYRHEQPTKTTSVRKSAWGRTYASLRAMSSSPLYCSAVCQTVCIRDGKIRDSEGADEKRSEAGTKRRMGWADNELQHLEQPDIFSGAFPLFSTRQENGNGGMARFDCRARFGVVVHGRRLADQGRGSTFNRKLLSERTSCDCSLVQDTLGLDGTCAAVKKQSFPSSTQQGRRQNLLHDHRAAYDPIYAVQALSALLGDMPSLRSGISPQKQQPSQPGVLLQVRMPGDLRQCSRRGILPETSGASVGQDSQTKAGNAGIETLHDMRRGIPDKQETQGDLWQGGMREGAEAKLSPTLLFGKPATNLTQCRVVSVEEEAGGGEVEVFDLEVRGNHNYFANGLLVHNCHHGLAASYGRIYKYFHQNPNLKHLGVTATPDRADEEALGKVYESVAMTYEIADAIHDGWLVPIKAVPVHIAGLDYSTIRTTAGDLNGADLANVMEQEAPLHEMVQAIVEVVSQAPKGSLAKALEKEDDAGFADEMAVFASQHPTRKTLIFAASVAHAERLSEILNRWLPGRATWVCGGTPKDTRKQLFADYKSGRYAFLVNVGVCLDEQTEILTSGGWIGIDGMAENHQVANWENGRVWFAAPKRIIRREREPGERMVALDTKNRSIRVTESHELLYRTNLNGGAFRKATAAELVGKACALPISGHAEPFQVEVHQEAAADSRWRVSHNAYALRKNNGMDFDTSVAVAAERIAARRAMRHKNPPDLTIQECQFVGFWLGDGTRTQLARGGVEYLLFQGSKQANLVGWVDGLIAGLGYDVRKRFRPNRSGGTEPFITWSFARGTGAGPQARKGLYAIEPYLDKSGSSLLWGLTDEQFTALIQGFWMADGEHGNAECPATDRWRICNTNRALLDTLQAIACCRGFRANISDGITNTDGGHKPLWRLAVSRREQHHMTKCRLGFEAGWKPERVWCVATDSGNIITRRRGTVTVMGNCTEGWDEPSIEVVVMARPTKSRALYTQMLGRGTRALPGVVDGPATPEARIEAIAASGKTHIVCVDFVGNCGRHTLMTPADILGGNYENDVVDLAKQIVEKSDGRPVDIDEALEQAKKQREEEKAREAARRAKVRVGAKYEIGYAIDPFELFKVNKFRERGWEKGKPVTDKMKAMLERQKIWRDDMSYSEARQLVQGMAERRTKGLCTFRQANALCKRGLPPNVSFETAHRWMDSIAANRWSVPSEVTKEAQELLR